MPRLLISRESLPSHLLGIVALIFGVHALQYPRIFEDAFISYRYADNLIAGHGLVFNPGETVEGYTSFLWVLVLAVARVFTRDLQAVGPWLSLAAGVAMLMLSYELARQLTSSAWAGLAASCIVAAHGSMAMYAVTGMESTLFAALITGAVYLMCTGSRPYLFAVTLVLAGMCRPEGVGYAGVLIAGFAWLHGWRACVRPAALWLALYGSYFIWRYAYFGYPFPNTYYAKVGGTTEHLRFGIAYVEGFLWLHLGVLGLLGGVLAWSRKQRWAPPLVGLILFSVVATAYVGGDIFPLFRFLLPITGVVAALTVWLVWQGAARVAEPSRPYALAGATALVIGVLLVAPHVDRPVVFGKKVPGKSDWEKAQRNARITKRYERVAAWLKQHLPPDYRLALNAVGVIPYRTNMPTIDMLGLTDKHIAHSTPPPHKGPVALGHEKSDPAYVLSRRPDVVFVGLPFVTKFPPTLAQLQRIWAGMLLPGDKVMLGSRDFGKRYQVIVIPVDATGFTAFFLRRDRLDALKQVLQKKPR